MKKLPNQKQPHTSPPHTANPGEPPKAHRDFYISPEKSLLRFIVAFHKLAHYCPNVSSFQYSCKFSLIHFITAEKSTCSFQRIFFKNALHHVLRILSVANASEKRAKCSLYGVFLFLKVQTIASASSVRSISWLVNN